MRKLGATGMAAALCAGLALATARADDGDSGDLRSMPPVKPSWWTEMFGSKEKTPEPKKLAPAAPTPPRVIRNDPASVQAREESALFRRLKVCDELFEVADKKDDEALREKIHQLTEKAWAVYQQRTAGIAPRVADENALTRPATSAVDGTSQPAARESASLNPRGGQP
jgi:hypothetical protein